MFVKKYFCMESSTGKIQLNYYDNDWIECEISSSSGNMTAYLSPVTWRKMRDFLVSIDKEEVESNGKD